MLRVDNFTLRIKSTIISSPSNQYQITKITDKINFQWFVFLGIYWYERLKKEEKNLRNWSHSAYGSLCSFLGVF